MEMVQKTMIENKEKCGTKTDLEALVLSNLKSPKHISEISQTIGINQKASKVVLRSLIKKGLVVELTDKHYKALRRGVDFGGYNESNNT